MSFWNPDTTMASFIIVLLMASVITAFAVFVTMLLSRIFRDESEMALSLRMHESAKEPPMAKAA